MFFLYHPKRWRCAEGIQQRVQRIQQADSVGETPTGATETVALPFPLLKIWVGKNNRVKGLILDAGEDTILDQSGRRPFWFLFAWQMKWKRFEAFAISAKSLSGDSFLGSTGHWPVPPGDSPGGTGSERGANSDRCFESRRFDLPLGESSRKFSGADAPVLPISRRCAEPGSVTAPRGQRKVLPPNGFRKPVNGLIGTHLDMLKNSPLFAY
jgi:hypothetical protein